MSTLPKNHKANIEADLLSLRESLPSAEASDGRHSTQHTRAEVKRIKSRIGGLEQLLADIADGEAAEKDQEWRIRGAKVDAAEALKVELDQIGQSLDGLVERLGEGFAAWLGKRAEYRNALQDAMPSNSRSRDDVAAHGLDLYGVMADRLVGVGVLKNDGGVSTERQRVALGTIVKQKTSSILRTAREAVARRS